MDELQLSTVLPSETGRPDHGSRLRLRFSFTADLRWVAARLETLAFVPTPTQGKSLVTTEGKNGERLPTSDLTSPELPKDHPSV